MSDFEHVAVISNSQEEASELSPELHETLNSTAVVVERSDVSQKFGMVIGVDKTACGGHAVTSIREGGVLDQWNKENTTKAICAGDILISVNGKDTFEEMMNELKQSLSCTIQLSRESQDIAMIPQSVEDTCDAKLEAVEREKERTRVIAAFIPGLKKIVESEFGPGAFNRIHGRVEQMCERIGRGETHEEDLDASSNVELANVVRIAIDAHAEGMDAGPKAIHAILQVNDERFAGMGMQKFKRIYSKAKEIHLDPHMTSVGESTSTEASQHVAVNTQPSDQRPQLNGTYKATEVIIERPDASQKFGMVIGVDRTACGGHAVTSIREDGVLHRWNKQNPDNAIRVGDIIVSVNGKDTFEEMMKKLKQALSCTIQLIRESEEMAARRNALEDTSKARKEAADEWEKRRARVTAALIPGLKKIVDSEFGHGAGNRIHRIEQMYERIGRGEVHEEDTELGRMYAPGYVEGLSPVLPFHSVQDYPWCQDLCQHWKAIRKELRACEENLWTPGAYQSSNEAYGKDWKIMGVLTQDQWQHQDKFRVTINAVKQLHGVNPFEVFFAKMPAKTKIADHSDNLNYILTAHLALDLEEDLCFIRVGNEERAWKEGEMFVIDTSYIHSTRNDSSRPRYVLVFRFWHPELTEEERRAIHVSQAILASTGKR